MSQGIDGKLVLITGGSATWHVSTKRGSIGISPAAR